MRKSLLLVFALPLFLFAQEGQRMEQTQNVRVGGAERERAPERKVSKEDRERGLQLLNSSEGPARGMRDSSTRAYALFQLARAYQQTDKAKAIELYKEAFTASIAGLEELDPRVKRAAGMQPQQILMGMLPLAPEQADELLPQIDPKSRERVVTQLLGYYLRNKQSDRALQMIYRIGQEKEIPYGAVSKLMETYGADQADDRQQLFTVAMASFRDHPAEHTSVTDGARDFGSLITQYYKELPSSLVMQAIDTVLTQARKIDSDAKDKEGPMVVSIASSKGAVQLNGQYEYRLFQLLPIVRELDPPQAERLAKEFQTVQTLLAKYPQGVGSLDTDKKNPGNGMSFFVGSGAPPKMPQGGPGGQPNPLEMERMQKILAEADKNPADALASAVTLSDPRMKMQTLLAVARAAGKKNTSVAHSALNKATESAGQLDGEGTMMSMRDIASVYLMLDEKDEAKKAIEKGISAADKIYKIDINADDPNLAPKPYWPSAAGYRGMMMLAMKISPIFAQEQLKEIPDQEMRTIAQIGLAQTLLNTPAGDTMVMSFTKESGKMMMMRDEEAPRD